MNSRNLLAPFLTVLGACASGELPSARPPLAQMQEPLELIDEPDDEAERAALPPGSFTGVSVGDARTSLDAMLAEPEGVLVTAVVENSPGAAAGVEPGDVLLEVSAPAPVALHWPSEWRRVELEAQPGTRMHLVADRAGRELELELTTVARVRPAARARAERFREEARVGVVLRAATEVEARRAALGPGAGAVVVGLTLESPWRAHGVLYGDLVRAIDGVEVASPQVLLDAIRNAGDEAVLQLEIQRGAELLTIDTPLARRAQELKQVTIPLLYSFTRDRDASTTSVLLGAVRWRRSPAAWDFRLLWLISFSGGDADRLTAEQP